MLHASAADPVIVKKITFDQAREITWQNSHVLKQTDLMQLRRLEERRAARGLYFPTIGVVANAMAMSDPITLDMSPVRDAITPLYKTMGTYGKFGGIPGVSDDVTTQIVRQKLMAGAADLEGADWNTVIQEKQFGFVAATAQWPVYAGGKIRAAKKAAGINQQEVSEISRQKQGELMSELAERYYGLCLARQVVLVRREVLQGLEQHLEDAQKLETEGMISNSDVLHARVYHAQASRELSKAVQQCEIVGQALAGTMAVGDTVRIETLSSLFYLDSIAPESYFLTQGRTLNPLLCQVESKKSLALAAYRAERADLLPAIAVQGAYDIADKDLSPYVPQWEVGIGLKWTVFDGVRNIAKVKAASIQRKEADEFGEKAQTDVATMINKLYHELTMYQEQLEELTSAKKYAEEFLRVSEVEFHQEMSNSTKVVDARLALAQVKTERLQAMYNYDVTLARLLEYSGISGDYCSYLARPDIKTESYQ